MAQIEGLEVDYSIHTIRLAKRAPLYLRLYFTLLQTHTIRPQRCVVKKSQELRDRTQAYPTE